MDENRWSPFDPEWYHNAFDKFISTADQLFNQNNLFAQDFKVPDADGSKSSVFRRDAVLNNSFNEELLKETLKDIYWNSSHRLTASNHDNVHFFRWHGTMADVELIPNTKYCDILLPTDSLIEPSLRDKYKLSQFYRKWVTITEMLNNWNTFKWVILLFIDRRIQSSYMMRMDDQTTKIRFEYNNFWIKNDYPVYVFKFDTSYQRRVKVTSELLDNQWNWKVPYAEYYNDQRILSQTKAIATFNRITEADERTDGKNTADPLGDNIEFISINNGTIDLSNISKFNKDLIRSDQKQYVWMNIIVPRFMHEFPIPIATDVVYRPYYGKYSKVWAKMNGEFKEVLVDESVVNTKNVYVNIDEKASDWNDGWKNIIKPMVLSDAFDTQNIDPYNQIREDLSIIEADINNCTGILQTFRTSFSIMSESDFDIAIEDLNSAMNQLYDDYNAYLKNHNIDDNAAYNSAMLEFAEVMELIREQKKNYKGFSRQYTHNNDFWYFCSQLLEYGRELINRYDIAYLIKNIQDHTLWEEDLTNVRRFKRPIDITDIWMFEYDNDDKVWRPCFLDISRHFPDVYMFNDEVTEPKVYKALFFYSDTMNVCSITEDITRPTSSWDDDMEEYMYDQGASYRDIFMEKFYWMGIKAIYKGLLVTNYRWEVLEYIQDNSSYERFNKLFLQTMDPYFKMGLATYLKSSNFNFPFDEAINKLNESINNSFLGYQKITNYEMYLNKTWSPSYFDYVINIIDGWDGTPRLLKRPSSTFDTTRLVKILKNIQKEIESAASVLNQNIDRSINELTEGGYHLQQESLSELSEDAKSVFENCTTLINYINELDMDIYSVQDVNAMIAMLDYHLITVGQMTEKFDAVYNNAMQNSVYATKSQYLSDITQIMPNIQIELTEMEKEYVSFDIEHFMYGTNNPDYFNDFDHEDDSSLIGIINSFHDAWGGDVIIARTKLYQSTVILWARYAENKQYPLEQIKSIIDDCTSVYEDIRNLRAEVYKEWGVTDTTGYANLDDKDMALIAHFDFSESYIKEHIDTLNKHYERLLAITYYINSVKVVLGKLNVMGLTYHEEDFNTNLHSTLDNITGELSYIELADHLDSAQSLLDSTNEILDDWNNFVDNEQQIFTFIISYTKAPAPFIASMDAYKDLINAVISYMDTCNNEFIPHDTLPTYSDIYRVTSVSLVSGGFGNKVDDEVYIPDIGVYKVAEVDDNIGAAISIEPIFTDDQNLSYQNPLSDEREYYSSTSGDGMGIIVKADSVEHTKIIDDAATDTYIEKLKNIVYLIKRDKEVINPYNNASVESTIDKINKLHTDWEDLKSVYNEYMNGNHMEAINLTIAACINSIRSLQTLISDRAKINFAEFLSEVNAYITSTYATYQKYSRITANYIYFDNRLRIVYESAVEFYGNGTAWNDKTQFVNHLLEIEYEFALFKRFILDKYKIPEQYDALITGLNNLNTEIDYLKIVININTDSIDAHLTEIERLIELIPEGQKDEWYKLDILKVSSAGSGYKVGDVIDLSKDQEYHIYAMVTNIDEYGGVTGIRPLLKYVLPERIYGAYEAESKVGDGTGLILSTVSSELKSSDSSYLLNKSSSPQLPDQYNDNDLFMFKFTNIHDLPIEYEIFQAGKQLSHVITRHEKNIPGATDIDIIYLNANDVNNLMNSSIIIDQEHYFVYRIDDVKVIDSGAGYTKGQNIYVATDQVTMKLEVTGVDDTPLKGITSVGLVDNYTQFNGLNPEASKAEAIDDNFNNIDDEYHESHYDKITSEGEIKPISPELPQPEYSYRAKRFDNLEDGLRNKEYMYGDIDMPSTEGAATDGDPDFHNYLGSRIDNSYIPMSDNHRWNGIDPTIPQMDPFIPDKDRTPPNQPIRGEYQLIDRLRIHNSEAPALTSITEHKIKNIVNNVEGPESGVYRDNELEVSGVDMQAIIDGKTPVPSPTVVVHGETIKAIDVSRIRDLIYGTIETSKNPPLYMDPCLISTDPKSSKSPLINEAMYPAGIEVATYESLPQHINEWEEVKLGDRAVVLVDEKHGGHRMTYTVRAFVITGYIIYNEPEVSDYSWNSFNINWMNINSYPDLPTLKAQYPDVSWDTLSYADVVQMIKDGKIERKYLPVASNTTYIHNLTVDDISVYNNTNHRWENLHDSSKWTLEVYNNPYGFKLLYHEDGLYSYDMSLYLNKTPSTQQKNAELKRNAKFAITSYIAGEVDKKKTIMSVNTSRSIRIRKLFPFEQKESYTISERRGYEMKFHIAKYKHYKNELHLEDLTIYNKTAARFENIMDPNMFEISFKDPKNRNTGYETQTNILQCLIVHTGLGFTDGNVWAFNKEYKVHVFGTVTVDPDNGSILTFTPLPGPNPPKDGISLEFVISQQSIQWNNEDARIIIEFHTSKVEVDGDGYIHNVRNPMAVLPKDFVIKCLYQSDDSIDYEIRIIKNPKTFDFVCSQAEMSPTFEIQDFWAPVDHLYILVDSGRIPLVNPATGRPTFNVKYNDNSMSVTYLNMYSAYEHLEIHYVPYPMRSVYVQRRIPSNGFIDLDGKINKPLNKKYFEFWVNGRLMTDEVTIISPTKLFLHGLKSLRNFEIIEINRDPNEYFSDNFLTYNTSEDGRLYPMWNLTTYLDAALEGNLEGDNYSSEEQEYLLIPVWKQVDREHPEFKNYPPNVDIEEDILMRANTSSLDSTEGVPYQFAVIDPPTLEGTALNNRNLKFSDFGFVPFTNDQILNMINEEWAEEIANGEIPAQSVVSDDEWYGIVTKLYDEYGMRVHTLDDSAYHISDVNTLRINNTNRVGRIVKNNPDYNLD